MRIIFSDHACVQMNERNIHEEAILRAMESPDKITRQDSDRFAVQKVIRKNGKKYLLIVAYDEVGGMREVVTAFLTTKFKKYL